MEAKRVVYPLDITGLGSLLRAARRKTGIKSKATLLRMGIERGLPILEKQLNSHLAGGASSKKEEA